MLSRDPTATRPTATRPTASPRAGTDDQSAFIARVRRRPRSVAVRPWTVAEGGGDLAGFSARPSALATGERRSVLVPVWNHRPRRDVVVLGRGGAVRPGRDRVLRSRRRTAGARSGVDGVPVGLGPFLEEDVAAGSRERVPGRRPSTVQPAVLRSATAPSRLGTACRSTMMFDARRSGVSAARPRRRWGWRIRPSAPSPPRRPSSRRSRRPRPRPPTTAGGSIASSVRYPAGFPRRHASLIVVCGIGRNYFRKLWKLRRGSRKLDDRVGGGVQMLVRGAPRLRAAYPSRSPPPAAASSTCPAVETCTK